jgi:hypothetical protein
MSVLPKAKSLDNLKMNRKAQLAALPVLLWMIADLSTALHAEVQNSSETQIRIPHVWKAPKLDDYLQGHQRSEELRIAGFRQRDPYDGQPANSPTTAYLSYDDENIYAVFVCQTSSGRVRAHLSRREELTGDETVSLVLDTFHDGRHAYEFIANPLGVQMDGLITEGQDEDFSFDTLWRSQGRLTADGYVVWMAIPFKSLRFDSGSRGTWGIALARYVPATNESSTWPYITKRVEGYVPQFATMHALAEAKPGHNFQFIPYVFASRQRFLDTAAAVPALQQANEFRGGLDAKYATRSGLTFDFTASPDFSQVESDEPQVTINQRYEVFFPEKRPFFTESAGFFQTPENLFFSRRIVDPQFGARATGRVSGWTLGLLAIDDRAPGRELAFGDPQSGERAPIGVARVQHDLGKESTLGAFFSQSSFGPSSNRVFSLDSRLKPNPNWIVTAQAAQSSAHDPDGTRSSGHSMLAELEHEGRHFIFDTTYIDRSPGFRADLGFIPRVDIRRVRNQTGYRWHPEHGPVVSFGPALYSSVDWDYNGQLQDWSLDVPLSVKLKRSTSFTVGHLEVFERFQNLPFRQHATYGTFSTELVHWAALDASYERGTNINYFPAPSLTPFLASSTDATLGFTLRPTSRLRINEAYIFDRLRTIPGQGPAVPREAVFNNHLLHTKVSYQFTRALSFRTILDYNAVSPNASLVDLERTRRVGLDFLLTYMLNPGTAIYAGYSDQFENLRLDPSRAHRISSPELSTGKQFFVKISYLIRF